MVMNIFVYGANSEIGAAVAESFTSDGAYVDGVSRSLNNKHGNLYRTELRWEQLEAHDYSGYDVIVYCYGAFETREFKDYSLFELSNSIESNFTLVAHAINLSIRSQSIRGRRVHVVLGSSSAYSSNMGTSIYCACKAALLSLVRCLNKELCAEGELFTLFSCGSVESKMAVEQSGLSPKECIPMLSVAKALKGLAMRNLCMDGIIEQEYIGLREQMFKIQ